VIIAESEHHQWRFQGASKGNSFPERVKFGIGLRPHVVSGTIIPVRGQSECHTAQAVV
jgi:hypothetical protein